MSEGASPVRVLFVCLGNICRSPTAEAAMVRLVDEAGLGDVIEIDSAGTSDYHIGEPRDRRSSAMAAKRGAPLRGRGRQISARDFDSFDYILAMDRANRDALEALAPTPEARAKVRLFRAFDPTAGPEHEVPDPYYGGEQGFADVFDQCHAAAVGLLAHIRSTHRL